MLTVIIAMLVILVLSGLVLAFVAFPNRGEELPAAPWLGEAMARAVDAAPTLDEEAADPVARKH
ncbi:hypothetical protein [Nocardioides sp.]|uniref:hypothetical protein n=1 Tax=Nocardioides sp. TaxID=35761 RepID=UPI0031FE75DE|nr:hypothetical protein [Nocardioides sp.]